MLKKANASARNLRSRLTVAFAKCHFESDIYLSESATKLYL
jgi:hypothetical protein